jgi:hypothetical protein
LVRRNTCGWIPTRLSRCPFLGGSQRLVITEAYSTASMGRSKVEEAVGLVDLTAAEALQEVARQPVVAGEDGGRARLTCSTSRVLPTRSLGSSVLMTAPAGDWGSLMVAATLEPGDRTAEADQWWAVSRCRRHLGAGASAAGGHVVSRPQ